MMYLDGQIPVHIIYMIQNPEILKSNLKQIGEGIDDVIIAYTMTSPMAINLMVWNYNERTALNTNLPEMEKDIVLQSGWRPLSPEESIYHTKGKGNENNIKYINEDGPEDPLSIFERIFVDLYYETPQAKLKECPNE